MKKSFYLIALALAMLMSSCDFILKGNDDPAQNTSNDSIVEKQQTEIKEEVDTEPEEVNLKDCDLAFLENGKLTFYDSKNQSAEEYPYEEDSVVNGVFVKDKYYYCVAVDNHILLRCIDLEEIDPEPDQVADWGLEYEKCVTETYGTCSPLYYYPERDMLGLMHEFNWDVYALTQQKLFDLKTGKISDWKWEQWERDSYDDSESSSNVDEIKEHLNEMNDNYWYDKTCLSDQIDFEKYADPEYHSSTEFNFVSLSPDNKKVLYMAILEWGDLPHGVLCISSLDGKFQKPLADTDCAEFIAHWLDDGTLVYVGKVSESEEITYKEKWDNPTTCVKAVSPDGKTAIISHARDFQVR